MSEHEFNQALRSIDLNLATLNANFKNHIKNQSVHHDPGECKDMQSIKSYLRYIGVALLGLVIKALWGHEW